MKALGSLPEIVLWVGTLLSGAAILFALFDPLPASDKTTLVTVLTIAIGVVYAVACDRLKKSREWLVTAGLGFLLASATVVALFLRGSAPVEFRMAGSNWHIVSIGFEVPYLALITIPLGIAYLLVGVIAYNRSIRQQTQALLVE
jgi:hypothetical protein